MRKIAGDNRRARAVAKSNIAPALRESPKVSVRIRGESPAIVRSRG
jgi:hypothetical protein